MGRALTGKGLEEYRRKRRFAVTPEPAPGKAAPRAEGPFFFMVHKHDARRLHYDLRLELEGVLASWAIPKGPSYDPAAKRLAVQTEDHPFEYGSFEGRIPEGEYGAGDSIIWDRGTYDTVPPGQAAAQRQKGHLVIELNGEKLKGRWHLVRTAPRGGKPQWLLFKARDGLENPALDVVEERPESVVSGRRVTRGPVSKSALRASHPEPSALLDKVWPPMTASVGEAREVKNGSHWLEVKYDGFRALAAVSGGALSLLSRNRLDLAGRFPEVARALSRLTVGEAVLDGEVVALDRNGVPRFQLLQEGSVEQRFVAFDLLWLEGEDLRSRPIEDRRDLLESVLANVPLPIEVSQRLELPLDEALEAARRRGLEGLIAKRQGSRYRGGRSRDWLKLKLAGRQEVAIAGYTPIKADRNEIGALLVAVHTPRGFEYAGKVGTGFDAQTRRNLRELLEADRVDKPPVRDPPRERGARWVQPRHVAEVAFSEWTRDGKLRQPSFQGLRVDKSPEECVREQPAQVAASAPAPAVRSRVTLTHGDRKVFPKSGITKAQVFHYYQQVAEVMVAALDGRPLAFEQYPKGLAGERVFRQAALHAPDWVTTVRIEHGTRPVEHVVVDRREALEWLANYNALTLHMWSSRTPHLDQPDWVVFDLDPGERGLGDVVQLAQALRGMLEEIGLASVPKTSGKRGLHVLVPIARGHTHDDALGFAVAVTGTLAAAFPDIATTERSLAKRGGRSYLDAHQNGRGKTVVAPYALRAVEGAPASTPLRWSEVTPSLDPARFNLKTLPARLARVGDLFAPALQGEQRLPRLGR